MPPAPKPHSVQMGAMKGLLASRLPAFPLKMTSISPQAPVGAPQFPLRLCGLIASLFLFSLLACFILSLLPALGSFEDAALLGENNSPHILW